jgi:hypothetical protein
MTVRCEKSTASRYTLRDKGWWADITVSHDGFVNIQSDYGSYSYCWSAFGDSIFKFLCQCDTDYLYHKFGGLLPREFNIKKTVQAIKKDILEHRKEYPDSVDFNPKFLRELWDRVSMFEREFIHDSNDFYRAVEESSQLPFFYGYDMSAIPVYTDHNFSLNAFLTKIWPEFIAVLKGENHG